MVSLFGFIILEDIVSIGRLGNLLNYGMAEVLQEYWPWLDWQLLDSSDCPFDFEWLGDSSLINCGF